VIMTGIYRIALLPGVDEKLFVDHMVNEVFDVLQLTRITSAFTHTLLVAKTSPRQFAWIVTVTLVTEQGYDFDQNNQRIQESVAKFGLLIATETYRKIAGA
jgi:hypothetical protein